jgi:cell division septum initiation protein DivIVA
MPDFTLTSPEGKSYTVTGPEGATQEQAFQVLQQQLAAGTAKEASTTPEAAAPTDRKTRMDAAIKGLKPDLKMDAEGKPTPTPTVKSALEAIGTSTALGGALGAVSPELLTGAGYAVSFIPEVGPTIGAALMEAGTAARAARVATAASGALSGAIGETAGQTAEASGAGKGTADAARLVGGMAAGPGVALANKAKGLFGAFTKLIGLEATPAAVTKAAAALRGTEDAGVPANALHQMLQHGADADIQSAQKAGEQVMADARQRAADVGSQDAKAATKVLDDGQKRADQIVAEAKQRASQLNKASGNRMATAGKVLAQAEPALRVVGQPREVSDIGKELQTAVSQQHQAALDARTQAYNNLKDQRDAIVKSKEGAGQTVEQTEGMKDLKNYIKGKVDANASPRQTTDQGTLRVYGQVNEALQNPSFEALDQVRRKLGDVLGGRDVEGYSAVGKDVAGKLYAKISDIQKEFVGKDPSGTNLQQMMQEQYHDASLGLRKFGTGAGGKAAAIDRVDPERFAADPAGVPKQFFSSQQSVRDLQELTGDSGLVQRAGSSYVSSQLRGMSAKQVQQFAQKNSDWLREVPGLQKGVADYATRLGKIEATAAKVSTSAEGLAKRGAAILPEAEGAAAKERAETIGRAGKIGEGSLDTQQRVLAEGGKAAEAATKAAAAPAQNLKGILQGGERPEAVRDLLLNGKPEQTRLAARISSQTSEGRKALEGSVRQITADMKEGTLQKQWNERLKPMLQDGKMLTPERFKALESDVQGLLKAYSGKPPVTMVQRLINGAIASAAGNYVGSDNRE